MIVKRLEAGAPAVIPDELLAELGLKPGDEIGFAVEDGEVRVFRKPPLEGLDEETGLTTSELRAFIAEGMKGPYIPAEEAFARLRTHAAAARSAGE
ncbi:MAG TPA: AbrB/MazE/SpoVT family DNA-binding domain-containing protein [Allosphingosinicella sp.]|jgi:bifunctional DNA-binding transcriptional regulator/antitoxin component of YhaV-PrlF toxin-antitoxin module